MNIAAMREDLRNGLGLEETLIKHNTDLETFFAVADKKTKLHSQKNGQDYPEKYILKRNGRFTLRKSINRRTVMFGVYDTLEEAILVREEFERIGWEQTRVDEVCNRLGVKRRKGYANEKVRYS